MRLLLIVCVAIPLGYGHPTSWKLIHKEQKTKPSHKITKDICLSSLEKRLVSRNRDQHIEHSLDDNDDITKNIKSIVTERKLLKSVFLPMTSISTAIFNRCIVLPNHVSRKEPHYLHNHRMKPHQVLGRVVTFWSRAGPIIAHYQWTRAWFSLRNTSTRQYRDIVYDKLHDRYAPKALDIILDMKGK